MTLFNSRVNRRRFLAALAGVAAVGGASKIVGPAGATFFRKNADQNESAPGGRRLKAAIVYYSATGSTLKAAKAIHRGLKTVMDCDIFPVKQATAKKMSKYDLVGFGSPIWYSRETANIKLFIHNMPLMPGKLAFLFCTHGVGPNGTLGSMAQTVEKRKLTIIGWNDWYGGVFHVLHQPKPYHTDGHPDKTDLDEAEVFGSMIGQKAQKIYAGDKSLIPLLPTTGGLWTGFHGAPSSAGGGMGMMGGGAPSSGASSGAPGGATGAAAPGSGSASKPGAAAGVAVAAAGALPKMGGGPGGQPMGGGAPSGGGPGGQPSGGPPSGGGQSAAAPKLAPAKAASGGPGGASAKAGGPQGGMGGPAISTKLPVFYMDKCVYPRCNACEDMCPVNAIDFSMVTPGRLSSGDQVLVKKACISCSLCERVCIYDAVIQGDNGPRPKTDHAIDLKICTYPKCTLCLDNCPMNAIDFSTKPPTFHHDCEGCDMCWCVCPTGAVSIPNMSETQGAMRNSGPKEGGAKGKAASGMMGAMNGGMVGESEAFLPENIAKRLQGVSPSSSPYRRLVPLDQIGYDHIIQDNPNTPRIIVDPEDGNTTYCSSPCKVQKS